MLNYTGEYCNSCHCQSAVTVIKSINTAVKSFKKHLTMNYVIADSVWIAVTARLKMLCLHIC